MDYPTTLSEANEDAKTVSDVKEGALTFSELADEGSNDPANAGR